MNDEGIQHDEWLALDVEQHSSRLMAAWSLDHVSLSPVAWWIATGGKPRNCDDDALDEARDKILRAAVDQGLAVYGKKIGDAFPSIVDRLQFVVAASNFDKNLWEPKYYHSPFINWNLALEEQKNAADGRDIMVDVIKDVSGRVYWENLTIAHTDMLRLWPETKGEAAFSIESAVADAPRRRGPKRGVLPRVIREMEAAVGRGENLSQRKEEEMAASFNASRDTCRKARIEVLSKLSDQN